ncbi:MAG: peptidyl-prolyl cis-trans isomerase B (cyclophilin B) [Marivirga sp.]|jgi:peptidyl-prolyl cis-trans isomerase B (cyclophilin B)
MNKLKTFLLALLIIVSCQSEKEGTTTSVAQIITPQGEMFFSLSDQTPNHKDHFIKLARADYWDSLTFNRVIGNFVIQGGCPDTPAGFTDPNYLIAPEFTDSLQHIYGALGMGRDDNPDKNSAICQFYIVHNKKGLPRLDGDYMIFGQLIKGWEVLEKLGNVPTDSLDTPLNPIALDVNILQLTEFELSEKDIEL